MSKAPPVDLEISNPLEITSKSSFETGIHFPCCERLTSDISLFSLQLLIIASSLVISEKAVSDAFRAWLSLLSLNISSTSTPITNFLKLKRESSENERWTALPTNKKYETAM